MAQKATVCKAAVQLADIDRGLYADHARDARPASVGDRRADDDPPARLRPQRAGRRSRRRPRVRQGHVGSRRAGALAEGPHRPPSSTGSRSASRRSADSSRRAAAPIASASTRSATARRPGGRRSRRASSAPRNVEAWLVPSEQSRALASLAAAQHAAAGESAGRHGLGRRRRALGRDRAGCRLSDHEPATTASARRVDPTKVLEFWFGTPASADYGHARKAWFAKDEAFDGAIRERFGALIERALRGELDAWARGAAIVRWPQILLLDQFTRNAFRGTARAFAGDARALAAASRAGRQPRRRRAAGLHARLRLSAVRARRGTDDAGRGGAPVPRLASEAPEQAEHARLRASPPGGDRALRALSRIATRSSAAVRRPRSSRS